MSVVFHKALGDIGIITNNTATSMSTENQV